MSRKEHIPQGNPCSLCGIPALRHRVGHAPIGNPCVQCGLPIKNHRVRSSNEYAQHAAVGDPCEVCKLPANKHVVLELGVKFWDSTYLMDPKCEGCIRDHAIMAEWRKMGGRFPERTCKIDHRLICECGERHENLKSRKCDECFFRSSRTRGKL